MAPSWSNSTSRTSISPERSCGSGSISVVVSDDESDEPSRMRFRVTKKIKRRKDRRPNFCFRTLRNISKWWFCLLLLPALVLFYSELFKTVPHGPRETREKFLSNGSRAAISREKGTGKSEKEGESNLNRLDMPTRSVNGVREPCLKLLPPEDIEHLELPSEQASDSPVRSVLYAVLESRQEVGGNATASKQLEMESQNFNLFTGNQTLQERQESFKVQETTTVHCGFYSERGGFDIDLEDKRFMNNCKAVVSTCTFGGGDDLYQPIGMLQTSLKKVCYVAFWDEITLLEQEAEGKKLGENRTIGLWRIIVVHNLPFSDQRLNGKIPKEDSGSIVISSTKPMTKGAIQALMLTKPISPANSMASRSNPMNKGAIQAHSCYSTNTSINQGKHSQLLQHL